MKYDCIFINGDSYSAKKPEHLVYGDFISQELGIPVKNFAVPGSNNQRILRSSIEYLNDIKSQYQNPLVIIGWSFIRRLEVWYYGNNQRLINQVPDNRSDSPESRFISLQRVINAGEATLEQKALINEDLFVHKQLMDFYTNLYMFAHMLESQNLNYVFFSAAKNTDCPIHCFPYIEFLQQVNWVANNPSIFKLHDFCIMQWAKENDPECDPVTGHLSENGHKKFSHFILNNLLN
jgi:hypothetical protein